MAALRLLRLLLLAAVVPPALPVTLLRLTSDPRPRSEGGVVVLRPHGFRQHDAAFLLQWHGGGSSSGSGGLPVDYV